MALVAVAQSPLWAQAPLASHRVLLKAAAADSQPNVGREAPDTLRRADGAKAVAPQGTPQRGTATYMNVGFSGLMDLGWSSEADVRSLQRGDHDPNVRGFTVPNEELTLDGAVDPYFKGFVNVVYKIDDAGESAFELEEAYILSSSLPANLQIKAGQFFTEFGRQNTQHPHAWAFVDQPLVLNQMFGADGMRGQGMRLSWLAPTSWYTEAMVTVQNSFGGTMHSFQSEESSEIHGGVPVEREVNNGGDLTIAPRLTTSFDLTSTQTLLLGVSGAFGPNNSGTDFNRTSLYGIDAYWRWKSATAGQGFPFFSLQAELMGREYEAAAASIRRRSNGHASAGDHRRWRLVCPGALGRQAAHCRSACAPRPLAAIPRRSTRTLRTDRFRLSPNFTMYPSEFSKVRLQYNYDDRKGIGRDHSLWLQFEFILGAHAAHRF